MCTDLYTRIIYGLAEPAVPGHRNHRFDPAGACRGRGKPVASISTKPPYLYVALSGLRANPGHDTRVPVPTSRAESTDFSPLGRNYPRGQGSATTLLPVPVGNILIALPETPYPPPGPRRIRAWHVLPRKRNRTAAAAAGLLFAWLSNRIENRISSGSGAACARPAARGALESAVSGQLL